MAKIKLTKTELKAQTDALKRFQRFLPMLQLKKQQLQSEIAGIVAKAEAVSAKERAVREGLDEESLAVYDLLKKPTLTKVETGKVKTVAKSLLDKLKAGKLSVDHWREKQSTRDGVRKAIFDFLFSETTGLPSAYSEDEIGERTMRSIGMCLRRIRLFPLPTTGLGALRKRMYGESYETKAESSIAEKREYLSHEEESPLPLF